MHRDRVPGSQLGEHGRIMSFSVLEPSEGISIGHHSALGGQSLVFCHGSWSNYLRGSPVARGPVTLGNEVWISWRCMLLAGTEIGDRAIVGPHSVARGKMPGGVFYSGVPARAVSTDIWKRMNAVEQNERLGHILSTFTSPSSSLNIHSMEGSGASPAATLGERTLFYSFVAVTNRPADACAVIDFERLILFADTDVADAFADHLSTYGVRLARRPLNALSLAA